jgi:hypothetical protein
MSFSITPFQVVRVYQTHSVFIQPRVYYVRYGAGCMSKLSFCPNKLIPSTPFESTHAASCALGSISVRGSTSESSRLLGRYAESTGRTASEVSNLVNFETAETTVRSGNRRALGLQYSAVYRDRPPCLTLLRLNFLLNFSTSCT